MPPTASSDLEQSNVEDLKVAVVAAASAAAAAAAATVVWMVQTVAVAFGAVVVTLELRLLSMLLAFAAHHRKKNCRKLTFSLKLFKNNGHNIAVE